MLMIAKAVTLTPSQCAFAMSASVSPARIRAHAILNPRADQVIE